MSGCVDGRRCGSSDGRRRGSSEGLSGCVDGRGCGSSEGRRRGSSEGLSGCVDGRRCGSSEWRRRGSSEGLSGRVDGRRRGSSEGLSGRVDGRKCGNEVPSMLTVLVSMESRGTNGVSMTTLGPTHFSSGLAARRNGVSAIVLTNDVADRSTELMTSGSYSFNCVIPEAMIWPTSLVLVSRRASSSSAANSSSLCLTKPVLVVGLLADFTDDLN